ncbi:MAG: putative bifunctional diguanylate cyclase/phosphodiesterase [Burkholderiales bacterium]
MIIKLYQTIRTSLQRTFPWLIFLLLPAVPVHAAPLYRPSTSSTQSHPSNDVKILGAGISLLTLFLALGMEWRAKNCHRKVLHQQAVLDTIPLDAALFDKAGRCLEILPGRREMPLVKGRHLHETLSEEGANQILEAIRKTIETGKAGLFEFVLPSSDMEKRYEASILPAGNRAICVCRNISSGTSLASENARLRSILQSLRNGVITTDLNGHVTYINPEAEKLTGWRSENAAGSPLSEVFNILIETSHETAEDTTLAAFEGGDAARSRRDLLLVRKDGSEIGIDESTAPIENDAGETTGAVIVFHDISGDKQLLWQAGHDALTGLLNRVLLHDRLIHSMASVKRQGKMLAVLFIDLDGFKAVNDNLGHAAGDMLLKEVALRLKKAIRAEDTAARIGGDEFVVLQESSDKHEVQSSLDRIMSTINSPFLIDGMPVSVSPSIGVALYPENDAEPETLLRQADMAMYHAKQSGRDQYHFFDSRMDVMARKNHERQIRIASALKNGELRLYYQPKINLKSGRVTGLEALIRWQDPDLGTLILPRDFLPAVQDTQLIVDIGAWVINKVMEQVEAWQNIGLVIEVSINVSGRQLLDPDFLAMLKAAFEAHPEVEPSRIEIEILETTAIADFDSILQILSGCRDIGVRLSLDDFGTGYSSLSYLKNLPVDRIKIDRSFVADMLENKDNLAIIRSIVSLSKIFNLEVIAEGLESTLQGQMLVRMGCGFAQGYGIAEPMPWDAVPGWMNAWSKNPAWMRNAH